MPRRFITAEDIRRVGSGELVVEPQTVVTPQALEAARAVGVVLKGANGSAFEQSAPDRGPDAARAEHSMPLMSEPEADEAGGTGVMVVVVGRNRTGVLAEITAAIAQNGGNVRDISQRSVEDYFHLVLTVGLEHPGQFKSLKEALDCLGGDQDFVARVMHERVFRYMHRV
jgi:ACT domain-containing protein